MPHFETWFVLEDGSLCNPKDVITGEDGKLKNNDGVAVAMRGADTPSTRSVDVGALAAAKFRTEEEAKAAAKAAADRAAAELKKPVADEPGPQEKPTDKEMESETKPQAGANKPYKNRESKTK